MGSIEDPAQSVNQHVGHTQAEGVTDEERRIRRAMRLYPKLWLKKTKAVPKMSGPNCPDSERSLLRLDGL